MDTSEAYIKMCEKATEIQKTSDGQTPAWASRASEKPGYYLDANGDYWAKGEYVGELLLGGPAIPWVMSVWLPRQDQLQAMVVDVSDRKRAVNLGAWLSDMPGVYDWSMERLWLIYMMHENYQKEWNGEDWVKEDGDG